MGLKLRRLLTKAGTSAPPGRTGALTMESKADTRLVMISSLRVKAELQRSGPQPLAGMSQRFPNKAMVTWMEGGSGGGRDTLRGCHPNPARPPDPQGRLYFPGWMNQGLASPFPKGFHARRH